MRYWLLSRHPIWFLKTDLVFYLFLVLQVTLSFQVLSKVTPVLEIVPNPPSALTVKALSFGDEQFYFRTLAFDLQNLGDTFGRFTALKHYDYKKLYGWWTALDALDPRSHFVPTLTSYYFSQSQNTPDVRYVVDYLDQHASRDLYHKWWWMGQAVYLANHKLEDRERALALSYKLASTPRDDIPAWTKQMPAFILEQLGEDEEALIIMKDLLDKAEKDEIDPGEFNFMQYFVRDRLHKMLPGLTDKPLQDVSKQKPKPSVVYTEETPPPPLAKRWYGAATEWVAPFLPAPKAAAPEPEAAAPPSSPDTAQ